MKCYFTFGQVHVHSVNGKTLDKDCIAALDGKDFEDCRNKAFELFDAKFHNQYTEAELTPKVLSYYPRGVIEV